jgi:predicted glutamine amidotransferase
MVSDYKTACSITLLDEVYFTDEYIAGYQLLESNLEQYLDDTIVEYANHIQALMDEEELDIEKLALDLDNNYETITSAPSGLLNTFTTDSTRVNAFKLTIGYLDLSSFYITLQDKADAYYAEYETQLNSITTTEDWATLKKTINKTISYLNIIETDLYNSADLSADLVSLVATGDQKTF